MLRADLIRPIPELLREHAVTRAGKPAFIDGRRAVSYGELAARTARLAGHLRRLGVGRGDRVAIYMDNSVEVAESYIAAARASAVGVCINSQAAEREVAYMLADSGARALLADPAHAERARKLTAGQSGRTPVLVTGAGPALPADDTISYEHLARSEPGLPAPDDLMLDEPAWMLYTSGTTGRPKGVLLSQRNCLWVVAACWAPITGLSADDYMLSPLPFFHSYALDLCVLAVLAVGATERVMTRFSVHETLALLRSEPVTFFPGVPTMFHYLLKTASGEDLGTSRLRLCVSAGAIMPAALNEQFEQAFGVPLLDGYGITETATMVTMNWPTGTRIMGSCGLPLPGSAVRIVAPGSGADVPAGQDGELLVQGPHVMLGYHNQPEATAEALRGGWYHTGDLGHRDEHGYITISGRTKELIIRGGENIYPAEVEKILLAADSVLDAAVIGKPDEALGEVPIAFVVPREPERFDPEALLATCRQQLAPFKVPADVLVVEEIPRTGSGKIMRYKLACP
ncbi:MAG: class I adenylate-forming enzyme family protein [Streptosporangiaceae bacterium]